MELPGSGYGSAEIGTEAESGIVVYRRSNRRNMARRAAPNEAHRVLARLQRAMGERMVLVTQNVDGLHRRAGHDPARLYEIHGNPDEMRCSAPCTTDRYAVPEDVVGPAEPEEPLSKEDWTRLRCPCCDALARPHLLWFDEAYTEDLYRIDTIRSLARRLSLLITIGTSGMTNLPEWIAHAATGYGAAMIDINPEPNPLRRLAELVEAGYAIVGGAVADLPPVTRQLSDRIAGRGFPRVRYMGGYGESLQGVLDHR